MQSFHTNYVIKMIFIVFYNFYFFLCFMCGNELREITDKYRDYIDIFDRIYTLKTFNEKEINTLYQDIKSKFLDTKIYTATYILEKISWTAIFNNRFFKSYWLLFKKLFDEYHLSNLASIQDVFRYFVYKEYGILSKDDKTKFDEFDSKKYSLDVHAKNTIGRAIMDDDLQLLKKFTEKEGFNLDEGVKSYFYPFPFGNGVSFLELSC